VSERWEGIKLEKEIELWEGELGLRAEERIPFRENTRNRYFIFLKQVPRVPSPRILDVGAGNGRLSFLLKKWSGGFPRDRCFLKGPLHSIRLTRSVER
jgi:hypothetical protein